MNKKLLCIVFAAVLAIGIVGCSSAPSSSSSSASSASPSSASASASPSSASSASAPSSSASAPASSEASASIGIPNPWRDVASAEEAAQGAGLKSFSVPNGVTLTMGKIGDWTFSCMDGMAQAKTTAGDTVITIRKAANTGDGDISGDYNAYEVEWPITLKNLTVNCAGHSQDAANKVLWVVGDNAYCIMAQGTGLTPDDINSLTNGIQ